MAAQGRGRMVGRIERWVVELQVEVKSQCFRSECRYSRFGAWLDEW